MTKTFTRGLLVAPMLFGLCTAALAITTPATPSTPQTPQTPAVGTTAVAQPGAPASVLSTLSGTRLILAILAIAIVIALVWGHARTSTTLRNSYLPQLPPSQQTYSLARWQMAFWFTLIFAAFVYLYILSGDYNTITAQALALMGISGTTALAAVAVDVVKDSPADAANRGLQALGIQSYDDVLRLNKEISDRETEATGNPPPARLSQLQSEIQDRRNILRTYEVRTRPFVTQGWFKDVTTDVNGPTVYRLQVLIWTVMLGIVFVVEVYRNRTMPHFSPVLLTLMGISGAGYVGFKYPEVNS